MKIAFIGLGNMGGPMAHNLHKAGHEVRAFDLSQPARDKLAADGVPIATDAKAAVAGAEVVISMLPASQHVEGLFLGAGDLLALLPAGTLIIDCSTIAAATSRKVAEAAKAKGVAFIDAPVSGGTGGAPIKPQLGRTDIFIYPPHEFQVVDALLTNFHLPKSTLLMLVSAFAQPGGTGGHDRVLSAYAEAVTRRYRFFSYGDAMFLH